MQFVFQMTVWVTTVFLGCTLFQTVTAIRCITCFKSGNVNTPSGFDCQDPSRLPAPETCMEIFDACYTSYTRTDDIESWSRGCTMSLQTPNSCRSDSAGNNTQTEIETSRCECNENGCNNFDMNAERLQCISCTKEHGVNNPDGFDCGGPTNLPMPEDCLPTQDVCYMRRSENL